MIFINSCQNDVNVKKDKKNIALETYLKESGVSDNSIVLLLQPSKCLTCQPEVLESLKTEKHAFIFHCKDDSCRKQYNTQKCIEYSIESISSKGIFKYYSEKIALKNGKIQYREVLLK